MRNVGTNYHLDRQRYSREAYPYFLYLRFCELPNLGTPHCLSFLTETLRVRRCAHHPLTVIVRRIQVCSNIARKVPTQFSAWEDPMITLPEVLECCTSHWKDHDSIAREFDKRYPPHWYSLSRHVKLLLWPDSPSINLRFMLKLLVDHGRLACRKENGTKNDAVRTISRYLYQLKT